MPGVFALRVFSLALAALLALAPVTWAAGIVGPHVSVRNGGILASTTLELDEKQIKSIRSGVSKEITIYVDLFRVWKSWPDEFVSGVRFTRTLKCDPVKKEFVATSLRDETTSEKRFSNCEALLRWALSIQDLRLSGTRALEPAEYFVKVTAEGRIRRLPSVVGYLFFFIRERDFNIYSDSERFTIKPSVPVRAGGVAR